MLDLGFLWFPVAVITTPGPYKLILMTHIRVITKGICYIGLTSNISEILSFLLLGLIFFMNLG